MVKKKLVVESGDEYNDAEAWSEIINALDDVKKKLNEGYEAGEGLSYSWRAESLGGIDG